MSELAKQILAGVNNSKPVSQEEIDQVNAAEVAAQEQANNAGGGAPVVAAAVGATTQQNVAAEVVVAPAQPGSEGALNVEEAKPATPVATEAKPATPKPVAANNAPVELSDDDFLKELQKRNPNVKSISDVATLAIPVPQKTEAEIKEEEEALRTSAIEFGLKNKIFDRNRYEAFVADSKNDPRSIALAIFAQEQKNLDANITTEEIDQRFSEYYLETEDDGHWGKDARKIEMQKVANGYLSGTYGDILNIENTFKQNQQLLESVVSYKTKVETASASFPKEMPFQIPSITEDGAKFDFSYKIPAETMKAVSEEFLSEVAFNSLRQGDVNNEFLHKAFRAAVIEKDLPKIIAEAAKTYGADQVLKAKMGRQGVIPNQVEGGTSQVLSREYTGHAAGILQAAGAN